MDIFDSRTRSILKKTCPAAGNIDTANFVSSNNALDFLDSQQLFLIPGRVCGGFSGQDFKVIINGYRIKEEMLETQKSLRGKSRR